MSVKSPGHQVQVSQQAVELNSIEDLKEIKSILDDHDVEFWLDQGTLLGAVRNNAFIPWDWDIDLSAMDDAFDPKHPVWAAFRRAGFYVFFSKKPQSVRLEKKRPHVGWRHVEIHFYVARGEDALSYFYSFQQSRPQELLRELVTFVSLAHEFKCGPQLSHKEIWGSLADLPSKGGTIVVPGLVSGCSMLRQALARAPALVLPEDLLVRLKNSLYQLRLNLFGRLLLVKTPLHYFASLDEVDLLDARYKVPIDVEDYLAFKYGADWTRPKADYDFEKEDGSLKHGEVPA